MCRSAGGTSQVVNSLFPHVCAERWHKRNRVSLSIFTFAWLEEEDARRQERRTVNSLVLNAEPVEWFSAPGDRKLLVVLRGTELKPRE